MRAFAWQYCWSLFSRHSLGAVPHGALSYKGKLRTIRSIDSKGMNRIQAFVGLFHLSPTCFCRFPRDTTTRIVTVEWTLAYSHCPVKHRDGFCELWSTGVDITHHGTLCASRSRESWTRRLKINIWWHTKKNPARSEWQEKNTPKCRDVCVKKRILFLATHHGRADF